MIFTVASPTSHSTDLGGKQRLRAVWETHWPHCIAEFRRRAQLHQGEVRVRALSTKVFEHPDVLPFSTVSAASERITRLGQ